MAIVIVVVIVVVVIIIVIVIIFIISIRIITFIMVIIVNIAISVIIIIVIRSVRRFKGGLTRPTSCDTMSEKRRNLYVPYTYLSDVRGEGLRTTFPAKKMSIALQKVSFFRAKFILRL